MRRAMKILHFSDIHLWRKVFDFRDPALKRFLGFVNLCVRRGRTFPPELSGAVVKEILATEADLVVFSGDLTTTALASEFRAARDLFQPLRDKWGERFLLIPGNHDRYTRRTLRWKYYEENFDYGAFEGRDAPVRTVELDGKFSAVAFDASVPRQVESTGLLTAALADAVDAELGRQAEAGRRTILVGHFPYAAPPPLRIKHGHRLVGAERLIKIIARRKPVVYLHGHKHRRWAFHPNETPDTLCVNAGSAGLSRRDPNTRAGFVEIDLDADGRPPKVVAHVVASEAPGPDADKGKQSDPAFQMHSLL